MNDSLYYYGMGVDLFEKGSFEEAITLFEKSYAQSPHFKTCERLALCYKRLNKTEEYKKYIRLAYEINPKSDKTAVEYAAVLQNSGQPDKAREILSCVLERNPTYGPATGLLKEMNK